MVEKLRRVPLARLAVRVGLGVTLTAGAVALSLPGGAGSVALALGAGGLVALSGLGSGKKSRLRATARRRA